MIVSQKKTIFLMTLKDKLCKILVTVSSKCLTVIDQINKNLFFQVIIVRYNIPKTIRGDSISSFSWIFYSAIWEKDKIDMVLRVLFEIKKMYLQQGHRQERLRHSRPSREFPSLNLDRLVSNRHVSRRSRPSMSSSPPRQCRSIGTRYAWQWDTPCCEWMDRYPPISCRLKKKSSDAWQFESFIFEIMLCFKTKLSKPKDEKFDESNIFVFKI